MKKLLLLLGITSSIPCFSQDTIILKSNPTPILCKITSVNASLIFYVNNGEHLSEYLTNVKHYSTPSLPKNTTDTIVCMDEIILGQIYAMEDNHLRYHGQNGVDKWIATNQIITCSQPWIKMLDSVNHNKITEAQLPKLLRRFLQNPCKDTAKHCELMAVEIGQLNFWNVSFDRIVYNMMTNAEQGALILSLDYGQDNPMTLLTPAFSTFYDQKAFTRSNAMVLALKYMVLKGWTFESASEAKEAAGQRVYHYTFVRH